MHSSDDKKQAPVFTWLSGRYRGHSSEASRKTTFANLQQFQEKHVL